MGWTIVTSLPIFGFWKHVDLANKSLLQLKKQLIVTIPWCFRSLMILVVAGPITSKFDKLMANIVAIGARALKRFSFAMRAPNPDDVGRSEECVPGNVRAITTGRADCIEK